MGVGGGGGGGGGEGLQSPLRTKFKQFAIYYM